MHGPVRVAETISAGKATVTLSFDAWKEAKVAPTTHTITVLPVRARPATEPTAPNFIATLVQPVRTAYVTKLQFSPDSARLFATGYPSGIVQIFDVATKKQVLRIDTPSGLKGTSEYALLAADWKTIYVPVEKRKVKSVERDGKKVNRIEYSGEIRVFDAATGKEKTPIRVAAESAPAWAELGPAGKSLIYIERPSYDAGNTSVRDRTIIYDFATGERRKVCDDLVFPKFHPDGKTVIVCLDREIEVRDLSTGKTLTKMACPDKERSFSMGPISPDGTVVAVGLGRKKDAPVEFWFLDAKTLKLQAKLIGDGSPHPYGWGEGEFTPDGKRFVTIDGSGNALVWNVADQKIERRLPLGGPKKSAWNFAFSPDSKKVAVAWSPPRADAGEAGDDDPDPDDLPQPRVSILDLTGKAPPRVLIAPTHGYVGSIAFSPDGRKLALGSNGAIHLFDLTK